MKREGSRSHSKQAWAERQFYEPIEINRGDRATLLPVPGIGPRSVERILAQQRYAPLRSQADLLHSAFPARILQA